MSSISSSSICSVSDARDVIEAAGENTPLIVDLDETLLLRNSTEEYLDSIWPRALGAVLLYALDVLKPWNWLPRSVRGEKSRDWMRVLTATVLFPWTLMLWSKRAARLVARHENVMLRHALNGSRSKYRVLATRGFAPIVAPLVKHLGMDWDAVLASRFWCGALDRSKGKLALLESALGSEAIKHAVLITDPGEDDEVVGRVATPCCVAWLGARYVPAMSDVYVPFAYIETVKHRDKRYIRDAILGDDIPLILLAYSWISPDPISHAISMIILVFSFWCIYEIGYYENDTVAFRFECSPVLSQEYKSFTRQPVNWLPWVWAMTIAMPGLALLELSEHPSGDAWAVTEDVGCSAAMWIGFLFCVRMTFWAYNYIDKTTRMWLYPLLQAYRYFGCIIVSVTNLLGAMLLMAQVLARWLSYLVYRHAGGSWRELPVALIRAVVVFFLMGGVAMGTQRFREVISWQGLIIILYCLFRARKQVVALLREAGPITRDGK